MGEIPIAITFYVKEGREHEFLTWLDAETGANGPPFIQGYRSGHGERLPWRDALRTFADEMERVLKAHDHKTGWRERPVQALISKMYLEVEEFRVAVEHFEVKEARGELVDIANFCMIISDRLSLLDQDKTIGEQNARQSVST